MKLQSRRSPEGTAIPPRKYGEHQDRIRQLEEEKAQIITEKEEINAALEKAAKKHVKLKEIDSVVTGKTVFGGKITVPRKIGKM